ncbi:hypothetical protein [Bacillus weihaiensis]|nr:hypothetical protein [Bacillus weihaiensis]
MILIVVNGLFLEPKEEVNVKEKKKIHKKWRKGFTPIALLFIALVVYGV